MWILTLVVMWLRSCPPSSFHLSSIVGSWRICSCSLLLFCFINAPSSHSFLLLFSLFPCCVLSLPTLRFPSLFLYSPSFSPIFHQCQRYQASPGYQAIMSMFTKALIHQNKERPRERGRRMDDKGKAENRRERETLECTLEWLWTVNPYSFLLLWLYFS